LYATDPKLTRVRPPKPHKFSTGTRDNVRAFTLGPVEAAGQLVMPLSADECIELLLLGIAGGVAPVVTTGVSVWTFKPGTSLASATLEWQDGANPWQEAGVRVDKLEIKGSANGDNTITADLFGMNLVANAITGSLADRLPTFFEGWETKLFVDAVGGTPGTTVVPGTLINWDVTIQNGLGRKFFANDSNATGAVTIGELAVTAKLTFEASAAAALAEFANWDAAVQRVVRLGFGTNTTIPSTTGKYALSVDIPGAWSAFDLTQTDQQTRVYALSLEYVYNTTMASGLQIIATNGRATAW
jgi:hypothetical protein